MLLIALCTLLCLNLSNNSDFIFDLKLFDNSCVMLLISSCVKFFADLITFIMPAITPTKKNIIINQGLVPKVLSKINPIIVPTATADTNSVLSLKAVPVSYTHLTLPTKA